MVPTLKVKVFAWLPLGDQFFWFREIFLQIKLPASIKVVPEANLTISDGRNLKGWVHQAKPGN